MSIYSAPVPQIKCENIMDMSLDDIRVSLFSILEPHTHLNYFDSAEYSRLMSEYAAIYQYASELYVHCISLVRHYLSMKDMAAKSFAMDRRDVLEQYLKAVKMQYESLSRKFSIFSSERDQEDFRK